MLYNGGHSNYETMNDGRYNLSPLIVNPQGRPQLKFPQ